MAWTELPAEDGLPAAYRSETGWFLFYFRGLRHEWVLLSKDAARRYHNDQLSVTQSHEALTWAESLMQAATGAL